MRALSRREARIAGALATLLGASAGVAACDAILVGGLHVGSCNPGETRCAPGNAVQLCDTSGQWSNGVPCDPGTCDPATSACGGECAPGQRRCIGDAPQACDSTGHFDGGGIKPCNEDAGQHCAGGTCVGDCALGDLRCGDLYTPERCNAVGQWGPTGETCAECKQCDDATGLCRETMLPDDSPCPQAPGKKCLLSGTCQQGQCTPIADGGQVECVAAGTCGLGSCDPATGRCTAAADGTMCSNDDACADGGSLCKGGLCTSSPPIDRAWAHWDLASPPDAAARYTFTDHVVFDTMTHLMWQRVVTDVHSQYSWSQAADYCACLNGAVDTVACDGDVMPEYPSGWRLPSRIELASLADYASGTIDLAAFPGAPPEPFWSSSPYADSGPSCFANITGVCAWSVDFSNPIYVGPDDVGATHYVRCVRGGGP